MHHPSVLYSNMYFICCTSVFTGEKEQNKIHREEIKQCQVSSLHTNASTHKCKHASFAHIHTLQSSRDYTVSDEAADMSWRR